jgi:hypothetical protein
VLNIAIKQPKSFEVFSKLPVEVYSQSAKKSRSEEVASNKRVQAVVVNGKARFQVKKLPVLELYRNRKVISQDQYNGGNELARCWIEGILKQWPSTTPTYEMVTGGSCNRQLHLTEKQAHLCRKFKKAVSALEDEFKVDRDGAYGYFKKADPAMVVMQVCCHDLSIGAISPNTYQSKNYMAVLRDGLDFLSIHFGFRNR